MRPFLWLCTEQWDNLRSIKRVLPSTHILLLSGLRDELVPPDHMRQLWNSITIKGIERRTWQEFPNGTHSECRIQVNSTDTEASGDKSHRRYLHTTRILG